MAMTNEQLTKWIDEIFGTIDEIKQNSGDISGLTRSVRQLREDLTATQEDVSDLETDTAGTVSLAKAALQHFTDGSATQALDLVADIIPVQAGTGDPSPTNVRAISGYSSVTATAAGNNLFNKNYVNAVFNGFIATTGVVTSPGAGEKSFVCPIKKGVYTVTKPSTTRFRIGTTYSYPSNNIQCIDFIKANDDVKDTVLTITSTIDGYLIIYGLNSSGETANVQDVLDGLKVEVGEVATPYSEYQANTTTISLGRTIYGGSADFTTGAETETLVGENIGTSENITWEDAPALHTQGVFPFTISGADYATESWMAEKYKIVYGNNWEVENGQIKVTVTAGGSVGCRLCDTTYTSLEALKTALTGSMLIHPITTPNTYTTTPAQLSLLQGENNVSATSGPITLTYAPDNVLAEVYAYIQKRFDTLAASLTAARTTRKTTKTLTKKED